MSWRPWRPSIRTPSQVRQRVEQGAGRRVGSQGDGGCCKFPACGEDSSAPFFLLRVFLSGLALPELDPSTGRVAT